MLMVWRVGALCQAVSQALHARFNPVAVNGEITGFSRAASGHCYFSIKDQEGQLRCAMFRRAASLLDFAPRDGEQVELRGRLGVHEARGDLQLVVESMRRAGQGALFEQFLQRKAQLEAEGYFDAARKRDLPAWPRGIGLITSLNAAALHDVLTALQRRVPHLPVVLVPASVQGPAAPDELVRALQAMYRYQMSGQQPIDVLLLVRGGGSLEDLWSFNSEELVRTMAASPIPIISGIGHETDVTLADFVADLRAPTPTAAAEMACAARAEWSERLDTLGQTLDEVLARRLDRQHQRLDMAYARLGRPSRALAGQRQSLLGAAHTLRQSVTLHLATRHTALAVLGATVRHGLQSRLAAASQRLAQAQLRLELLDPSLVLQRGYAWLEDEQGRAVTQAAATHAGQRLKATLHDGKVDIAVLAGPTQ